MKSTLFKAVKLIKTIELKIDEKTAIKRLQSLENNCYTRDGNDNCLAFYCTDKGQLIVSGRANSRSLSSIRINDVRGQIEKENGKTVVKIYSVHDRSIIVLKYVLAVLYALYIVYAIADMIYSRQAISGSEIFTFILGGALVASIFMSARTENKNTKSDFEIMTREIERRIESAERWDELKPLDFD